MRYPHPALRAAADAALDAWNDARRQFDRHQLIEAVGEGADGTTTSRLDLLVEQQILRAVEHLGVDVLSEEAGHVDFGSEVVLVIDPVDGTGNAAAGVPFAAFTGAIAVEGRFVEGLTHWFDGGKRWWAHVEEPSSLKTSGRRTLEGSIVSMIRPKGDGAGFLAVAGRADRVRVLGSSAIEAALVAAGRLDAALDAGSRTHRIVDIAAAVVLLERAGGVLVDVHGSPVEFTYDVTRRWSSIAAASPELAAELVELVRSTTPAHT